MVETPSIQRARFTYALLDAKLMTKIPVGRATRRGHNLSEMSATGWWHTARLAKMLNQPEKRPDDEVEPELFSVLYFAKS
jgi:hypothetical protein